MKVVIVLSCLLLASSSFFCMGMQNYYPPTFSYGYTNTSSYQNNQNNSADNQNQLPPQPPSPQLTAVQQLSPIQQITLSCIESSLHLMNTFYSILPYTITIPMDADNKTIYTSLETVLGILAAFLERAYEQKIPLKVNGMQYTHENKIYSIYPISIALDFSHAPLLIACKKLFDPNNNYFPSAMCLEGKNIIPALEKYRHKQEKFFNHANELTKKVPGSEVHSYFISELAKLPKIYQILTDPKCYE